MALVCARDLRLEVGLYSDQSRKGGQGRACLVSRNHATLAPDFPGGPRDSQVLGGVSFPLLAWHRWAGAAYSSQRTEPRREADTWPQDTEIKNAPP